MGARTRMAALAAVAAALCCAAPAWADDPSITLTSVTPSSAFVRVPGDETFTYTVENTSSLLPAADVSVTDSDCSDVSPPTVATLLPGDSADFTCTRSVPAATTGLQTETGTAHATGLADSTNSGTFTALDPGLTVSVDSTAPPYARPGAQLDFAYTVINTGDSDLSGVTVNDSACSSPSASDSGALAAGATRSFTCSTTAPDQAGALTETVSASATGVDGAQVTSHDDPPSQSTQIVHPAVEAIAQSTAFARPGDPITIEYTVTNSGDSQLHGVSVSDEACSPVTPTDPATIEATAKQVFTCTTTAPTSGPAPDGNVKVSATGLDDASVPPASQPTYTPTTIIHPALQITRLGPASVERGAQLDLSYVVKNTSADTTVTGAALADDACPSGSMSAPTKPANDSDDVLGPGEEWAYSCSTTASGTSPIASTATASGTVQEDGKPVSATATESIAITERPVQTPSEPAAQTPGPAPQTPGPPTTPGPVLRAGTCINLFDGTAGRDVLNGSPFGDVLLGAAGDDRLNGLGGDDCVLGDAGDDTLFGGAGDDDVRGLAGNDSLDGGAGNDSLDGGRGNDRETGDAGNDVLVGGPGNDTLIGGPGRDSFSGGPGNDVIDSRDGVKETVNCGPGRDRATADRRDRLVGCERVKRR